MKYTMPKECLYHKPSHNRLREENLLSVMSVRAILENSENTLATIESELVEGKDLETLYDSIKSVQNDLNAALTKLIGSSNQTREGLEESDSEGDDEENKTENGDNNERSPKKIKTS